MRDLEKMTDRQGKHYLVAVNELISVCADEVASDQDVTVDAIMEVMQGEDYAYSMTFLEVSRQDVIDWLAKEP